MRTIARGDVYFVKGAPSEPAYPVLIIRAPMHWDPKRTVTVIPSYGSYTGPNIEIHNYDRYGYRSSHNYHFIPHLITTIPVDQLSRYIGRLSDDEMRHVVTNLTGILTSDPSRTGSTIPGPANIYEKPLEEDPPVQVPPVTNADTNRRPAANLNQTKVTIKDSRATVTSPSSYYLNLPENNKITIEVSDVPKRESWMNPAINYVDPNVSGFPDSIIPKEKLKIFANNFRIPDIYYNGKARKRPIEILTNEERDTIRDGIVSGYIFQEMVDIYNKLTPVDALFFMKWMPSSTIQELLDLSWSETKILKNICVALEKITVEEMENRLSKLHPKEQTESEDIPEEQEQEKYPAYATKTDKKRAVDILRPYIARNGDLMSVPEKYAEEFIRTPFYLIKSMYNGKNFNASYQAAVEHYRNILESKSQEDLESTQTG